MYIHPKFINGRGLARRDDGLWGMVDINGRWVVEPEAVAVREPSEGLIAAEGEGRLWGYIDLDGKWVISPRFQYASPFHDGVGVVKLDKGYGLVDRSGKWVKEPAFRFIDDFAEGIALAKIDGDEKGHERIGFLDTKGGWAIPPIFSSTNGFLKRREHTFARKYDPSQPGGDGEKGWINRKGEFFENEPEEPGPYDPFRMDTRGYDESLIPADDKEADMAGYKDRSGNWAIPPRFDYVQKFQSNGLARAVKNNKLGLIDKKGSWVVSPQYDDDEAISDFQNGLAVVKTNKGLMGLMDSKGKWVLRPTYAFLGLIQDTSGLPPPRGE
jgi:hypothetical protein